MGIRGLKTFIEEHCPGGTLSVNISDRVKTTLTESGRNEASLAIDTNSYILYLYGQADDSIGFFGGQWKEYQLSLQKFITDCKKLNLNLIFFFDGTVELGKKSVWFERRETALRSIENLFTLLDIGVVCKDVTSPPGIEFTGDILSSLGQTVICAEGDADYDIMKFAVETPECIGVLANDTDYLVHPDSKPVFLPEDFEPENNKALIWNKSALLQTLCLEEEDMPAFACLMGNDMKKKDYQDEIFKFKKKLGGEWNQSAAILLNSFKEMNGCNLKMLQDQVLPKCEEFVFLNVVRSYILPNHTSPWLPSDNHVIGNESARTNKFNCSEHLLVEAKLHSGYIYSILKFGVTFAYPGWENYIFEPEFVVYRYIRERLYGIILSEINSENKVIEEWIGYTYNRDVELCHPIPVMYKGKQVKLQQIWKSDFSKYDKIQIFEQCLGLPGHIDALKEIAPNLPENLIILSYLVCYMAQNITNLTQHDIECLVECAVWCNDVSDSFIRELPKVKPKARAIELATKFCSGLMNLESANSVCGKPFNQESFIPSNIFDGLLFQSIYQDSMKFQKTSKSFRKELMDSSLCKLTSHQIKNEVEKVTHDNDKLNLRPQRRNNFECINIPPNHETKNYILQKCNDNERISLRPQRKTNFNCLNITPSHKTKKNTTSH